MTVFQRFFQGLIDPTRVEQIIFGEPIALHELGATWYYSVTSFKSGDDLVAGYSVDQKKSYAVIKSSFECIERSAMYQFETAAVSSAAHVHRRSLESKLLHEALERDSLICWALGIISPEEKREFATHNELTLPTARSGFKTIVAYREMDGCYAFGSGCAKSQKQAAYSAKAELVMSFFRHRRRDCSDILSVHDRLHANTSTDRFKALLEVGSRKMPKREFDLNYQLITCAAKWPIKVMVANSIGLFMWNSGFFENIDMENQNTILARSFGSEAPSFNNIVAG